MKKAKLTPAQLSRSQSGRGKDLEDAIDLIHYRYLQSGRAYPVKNFPEVTIQTRSKGKITGYLKKHGAPDYTVLAGGFSMVFDAKRSVKRDFPFGNIEEHQAKSLSRALAAGAFAFLLVQTSGGRWVVPWAALVEKYTRWRDKDFKRGTGATVASHDELAEWAILRFKRREAPDYLALTLAHLRRRAAPPSEE